MPTSSKVKTPKKIMLSTEQQRIVDAVCSGKSVMVEAVPGSGKTTVALHTARQLKLPSIILSYNRALADATRNSVGVLEDCEVFTFHSLLSMITGELVHDDTEFVAALGMTWDYKSDTQLLVIDEAQDLKPFYFQFICRFLKECCEPSVRLLVMGDPRQMLYDFYEPSSKADVRFMMMIDKLIPRSWEKHTLNISFRTTVATARFLNHMSGSNIVPREEAGELVQLHVCDIRSNAPTIIRDILRKVTNPSETTILLSSTNTRSVATDIVRVLSRSKIPSFVIRSGDAVDASISETEKSTKGRVTIRTYHSAKGLQSPIVIVVNTAPFDGLRSNPLYVALTRSVQRLIVLQEYSMISASEIESIPKSCVQVMLRVQPVTTVKTRSQMYVQTRHVCSGVFRFMDYSHMERLLTYTKYTMVSGPTLDEMDSMVSFDNDKTFVNMGVIYYHAALLMVEQTKTGRIQKRYCRSDVDLQRLWINATTNTNEIQRCLMIATYNDACASGYMDKVLDIRAYDTIQELSEAQYRHDGLLPLVKGTQWHVHATAKHGEHTITAYATVRDEDSCTISICKPTAKEDVLHAALVSIVFDVSYTRIVNILDGSAMDVYCVDKNQFLAGIFNKEDEVGCVFDDAKFVSFFSLS